jgi:hypothetical protein
MELDNALAQIAAIHQQMERTRIFRGYRAATTLMSAVVAVIAGGVQAWLIPNPSATPLLFADLWVAVAMFCSAIVATEMIVRYRRSDSPLQRELTLHAIEQFLPCMIVGGLVTLVLCDIAHAGLWMLPGLWEIFFGMGMMASRRLLPRAITFVAGFYLLCGLFNLAYAYNGGSLNAGAFSPWSMAIPFGIGQTATAFILHWSLERHHGS